MQGNGENGGDTPAVHGEASGPLIRDAVLAIVVTEIPRQDVSLFDILDKTGPLSLSSMPYSPLAVAPDGVAPCPHRQLARVPLSIHLM